MIRDMRKARARRSGRVRPTLECLEGRALMAAAPTFIEPAAIPFPVGDRPSVIGVAVADFNRDGKADAAVLGQPHLRKLGHHRHPARQRRRHLRRAGRPATARRHRARQFDGLLAQDFNRDSKTDLAVASPDLRAVVLYLGNGDGNFAAPTVIPTGIANYELQSADLRGTGRLDLVALSNTDNKAAVLFNNGDGTFSAPVIYSTGSNPTSLALIDVDGKNGPDMVIGSANDDNVETFLNDGKGGFSAPILTSARGAVTGLVAADFNGDGKVDVVVGGGRADGHARIRVPRRSWRRHLRRAGRFGVRPGRLRASKRLHPERRAGPQRRRQARPAPRPLWPRRRIRELGDGGPGSGRWHVRRVALRVLAGRVAGSDRPDPGRPDRSVCGAGGRLPRDGNTGPPGRFVHRHRRPGGRAVAAAGRAPGPRHVPRPQGIHRRPRRDHRPREEPGARPLRRGRALAVATLGPDAVNATLTTNGVILETSTVQPGGSLAPAVPVVSGGANVSFHTLVSGDFEGTGLPGLAYLFQAPFSLPHGGVNIEYNNGDGTFTGAGFGSPNDSDTNTNLATGDLNGDGKTDLAVLRDGPTEEVDVFLSTGRGFRQTATLTLPGSYNGNTALVTGDFSGDGKADVVVSDFEAGQFVALLYKGNGDGTFAAPVVIGTATTTSYPITQFVGADLRGDGRLDLIGTGTYVEVFLNNGDGTFAPAVNYPGYAANDLKAADLNGDGIPDLAVANYVGNLSVLTGNGDGTFAAPVTYAHRQSQRQYDQRRRPQRRRPTRPGRPA